MASAHASNFIAAITFALGLEKERGKKMGEEK
jgi:hypothetical protein